MLKSFLEGGSGETFFLKKVSPVNIREYIKFPSLCVLVCEGGIEELIDVL